MSKTINAGRVTFVPKDNFSNNISYKKFDIVTYNGSSYFAKKDTIGHTPTEDEFWQLVAEKGQNGAPGAVKMQVVDTLPETGETDTIYLVKKDNPGEQNLYDEYVYTDTGWEHIGDTSVDLSNYYTKEESDTKLLAKQDKLLAGDNITISEDNVISVSGIEFPIYRIQTIQNYIDTTGYARINDQSKLKITEKINKAYKNGLNSIGFIVSSGANNEQYLFVNNNNNIQNKPTNYWLYSIDSIHNRYNNAESYSLLTLQLTISLSWTGDTCSCTSASIWKVPLPLLATNNSAKYTPTGDYNPATKKYVDDQVGNINTILATLTTVSEVTK